MQISPINSTNQTIYSKSYINQPSFKMNIKECLEIIPELKVEVEATSQFSQIHGFKMPKREDYFKIPIKQLPTMEEFENMVNTLIKRNIDKKEWIALYKKAPYRTLAFFNMKDCFGSFFRDFFPPSNQNYYFNIPEVVQAKANRISPRDGDRVYGKFNKIIDSMIYMLEEP